MPLRLNKTYCMDVLKGLRMIKDNSVDLCVTSPPYNKGYWSKNRSMTIGNGLDGRMPSKCRHIDYGVYNDTMQPDEYERWQTEVMTEILRVLKPNGSLFYNHKDLYYNHRCVHPTWVYKFNVKQVIVWNRKNTPILAPEYFFPIHEYLFWVTKGGKVTFHRKAIDVSLQKSIWEIPPATKNSHPAPFPETLVDTCVRCCTRKGGLILDPFMGSGTTAKVAKLLGRNFIGFELNKDYINL